MLAEEISTALSLHNIRNHDWHVQAGCFIACGEVNEGGTLYI